MYDKINQEVLGNNRLKRTVFNFCLKRKIKLLEKGKVSKNTIWDKIVFRKVQKMFGGRVRICITG